MTNRLIACCLFGLILAACSSSSDDGEDRVQVGGQTQGEQGEPGADGSDGSEGYLLLKLEG